MLYHTLMLLSRIICCLPYLALQSLGKWLGLLYHAIDRRHREAAVRQMADCLSVSEDEARRLVRLSFINLGRVALDIFYTPVLTRENFREYIDVEHLESMQAAWNEGKGVIIYTAHIGTWEWLSVAFPFLGFPSATFVRTQSNTQVTRFLNTIRERNGVEVFATRSGPREMMAAARALRAGKVLGILADSDAGEGGIPVDFFGKPFSAPRGQVYFSEKFGAPVIPAFMIRREDGRHKLVFGNPMHLEKGQEPGAGEVALAASLTGILEKTIRDNPTQWIWYRRLWNTFAHKHDDNK